MGKDLTERRCREEQVCQPHLGRHRAQELCIPTGEGTRLLSGSAWHTLGSKPADQALGSCTFSGLSSNQIDSTSIN